MSKIKNNAKCIALFLNVIYYDFFVLVEVGKKPVPVLPANSPTCSNCKKPILGDSTQIKCEGGHGCCEICFDTAVDFANKYKQYRVACPVKNCVNFFSTESVKDNVKPQVFKKLSSFNQSITQSTPFIYFIFIFISCLG
jgi:hypothetical protein